MPELDPSHHVFRHVKKSWMDGDFINFRAFRLRQDADGTFEDGLSVNWVEFFQKPRPQDAIGPLKQILAQKRTIAPSSKFALLNVEGAKTAAGTYTSVSIVHDPEPDDPSHALIQGFALLNDQVAEELSKSVLSVYPSTPSP